MHGIYLMEALETVENLFQVVDSFSLRQLSLLLTVFFKVTSIAELCDYEYIIPRAERVNKLNDIIALYLLEDLDLGFKELLEFGDFFNLIFAKYLNGKNFISFSIYCFVHCTV